MEVVSSFVAGFTAGWVVRSTVDSSRKLAVRAIAAMYAVADRTRQWVAVEREFFEDLVAEGRSEHLARASRAQGAKREAPVQTPRAQNQAA